MRTHRHVSIDRMHQAREHYRCVVLTDYRGGQRERTQSGFLYSFVRSLARSFGTAVVLVPLLYRSSNRLWRREGRRERT